MRRGIPDRTDANGYQWALIGAERVRTNIEKIPFPDIGSDFKITVSIGLSEYKMRKTLMILLPVQTKPFTWPKMVDETALNLPSD